MHTRTIKINGQDVMVDGDEIVLSSLDYYFPKDEIPIQVSDEQKVKKDPFKVAVNRRFRHLEDRTNLTVSESDIQEISRKLAQKT